MKKCKSVAAFLMSLGSLSAVIAAVPLLASCASLGLYNMSDEWCAGHLDATAAKCPANQALAHRTPETGAHTGSPASRAD